MNDEDANNESFEERIRSFARELGRSAERMAKVDIDEIADSIGVDPDRAREWADTASRWLRGQVEGLGEDFASRGGPWSSHGKTPWSDPADRPDPSPAERLGSRRTPAEDPLSSAAPHPLDVPSDEQGAALAALDSGRWSVEAGSNMLTGHGDGNGPSDALGLVRELHSRDWIDGDGAVTLVGHRALSRWLDAANHR